MRDALKASITQSKEFGDLHDDSITSLLFTKYDKNRILTNSADGSLKLFDIRMEKILKRFTDCDLHSSGMSKALISSGGQLILVMSPTGQIYAFDLEKEQPVGQLGVASGENNND